MMNHRSDPHVLRGIAEAAVAKARNAWRKSRASPSESTVREAFQLCYSASRALKELAEATPEDSKKVLAAAGRLDVVADDLKYELVRIVEGP
jgi:hypothetical protein